MVRSHEPKNKERGSASTSPPHLVGARSLGALGSHVPTAVVVCTSLSTARVTSITPCSAELKTVCLNLSSHPNWGHPLARAVLA